MTITIAFCITIASQQFCRSADAPVEYVTEAACERALPRARLLLMVQLMQLGVLTEFKMDCVRVGVVV